MWQQIRERQKLFGPLHRELFDYVTLKNAWGQDGIRVVAPPVYEWNLAKGIYSGAPAAEGRQAEPHTHIRKLKGTHELIFSCVSWLAVLLVGAYARRRRRRRRWWSRATWRPQLTRKPKRGFSFRGLSL